MSDVSNSPTTHNSNDKHQEVQRRITETIASLNLHVDPGKLTLLSDKSLEEIKALQEEIAAAVPVGNVAGLIFNGLTRVKGRIVAPDHAQRDILALMRGLEIVPKALYGAVFASPAAILFAYQKMLTLAGKDINTAFPDGLWQFYLEFSMREDTARHTNETKGFHQALDTYHFNLSLADQLTAWVSAIVNLYFQYSDLLLGEWKERVFLNLLKTEVETIGYRKTPIFNNLRKKWLKQKPFRRGQDTLPTETYPQYRQRKFDLFCKPRLERLPTKNLQHITQLYETALEKESPSFQAQMTILATLDPDRYKENRRSIPLWQTRVAIIWQDIYHLLPACAIDNQGNPLCFDLKDSQTHPITLKITDEGNLSHPQYKQVIVRPNGLVLTEKNQKPIGQLLPLPIHQLRNWIGAIISGHYQTNLDITHFDTTLLKTSREEQIKIRKTLNSTDATNLEMLKMAPIIINWDKRLADEALAISRLGRRGVGDHALTIFRAATGTIFDQPHIFFDGVWGSAVVEILTSEAISWAAYLAQLPPLSTHQSIASESEPKPIIVTAEATVEATGVDLGLIAKLRQNLLQRDRNMAFTVNDLLVLYRAFFNQQYQPSPNIQQAVADLAKTHPQKAQDIQMGWKELKTINPVLLIPMDATNVSPKDRLYPVTFWNPMPELFNLFEKTYNALITHRAESSNTSWRAFNELRSQLVRKVHHFGHLLLAHKKVTLRGHNQSLASLKLLGHLPPALQKLLEQLPEKFESLNELLKGEEVFSNVGRVGQGTSLVRFMSARDDNEAKIMVWGILTDDQNIMHISLRDFRPEVTALFDINQTDLAQMIAQDFLDNYVIYLNIFVDQLNQIAAAVVGELV